MNIRKQIDYSTMHLAIEKVMAMQVPQMELYYAVGRAVGSRKEKGAAVAAAEYIAAQYPKAHGFSPRNVRRMRDFYRTYESHPALLFLAMQLNWTQNVVIMEADLTVELLEWYLRAAKQFGWSKTELTAKIAERAHLEIVLDIEEEVCDNSHNEEESASGSVRNVVTYFPWRLIQRTLLRRCRGRPKRGGVPWRTMWLPTFTAKRTAFMRC